MIPQWLADEVEEYRLNLTRPPQTILDIGANIGAFSAWARRQWPEAVINAYEPVFANATAFMDNCQHRATHLTVAAVRATAGNEYILSGKNHSTGSFHDLGRQTAETNLVKCIAADTLPRAELVKIDTEGCEVEILRGLDLSETRAVVCEYHRAEDEAVLLEILEAQGFEFVRRIDYTPKNGLLKYARPGAVVKAPRPNLFIAIPTYGGTPIEFTQSLLKFQTEPPCDYSLSFMPGDSLVSRARNTLTAEFLKSECTHLLFIDSDLIFSSEQIRRLLEHDVPLVAGFYPKKKEGPVEWVCNALPTSPRPCGLQPVRYMGTGFLLIQRAVFEAMLAKHGGAIGFLSDATGRPEFDFWSVGTYETPESEGFNYDPQKLAEARAFGLSEAEAKRVLRTRYLSEDWYFCQRWLDLGGTVWGDTRVILKHIGHAVYPLKGQVKELL